MNENPVVYELVDDGVVVGVYDSVSEAEKALSGHIDPLPEIRARRLSGFEVYTPEQAADTMRRLDKTADVPMSVIGRALGLSRQTVTSWANGKTLPKLKPTHHVKLLALSRTFLN